MEGQLEIFDRNAEMACGGYRDVFLGLWRTAVTADGARRVAVPMERMATQYPKGLSLLFVMDAQCKMPDGAAREVLSRDVKRHESFTRHMALVYEGKGFMAATFRSVLTGMQMLSRQAAPLKVFATVDEAARWMAEQRVGELVAADLAAAFQRLRDAEPATANR